MRLATQAVPAPSNLSTPHLDRAFCILAAFHSKRRLRLFDFSFVASPHWNNLSSMGDACSVLSVFIGGKVVGFFSTF
jgi:hypothetical protein